MKRSFPVDFGTDFAWTTPTSSFGPIAFRRLPATPIFSPLVRRAGARAPTAKDYGVVLRKAVILVAAIVAVLTQGPARGATAAACGLPDSKPLWIDFTDGTVPFGLQVFGKPGITIATPGTGLPPQFRQTGAGTAYWEMKLGSIVGTTTAPADPELITGRAQAMFDRAVARSGCATPLIALNELNGASTTTPWTTTNAQYRTNVLELMRQLSSRGARPFLLVNSTPYTGGEAADWWRQAAAAGDLVPEIYFNAPRLMKQGVILGSRRIRTVLRSGIAAYTAIGIPVAKLGFMLGFQSGPGAGGREGLRPSSAWFEYTKLYTLAAKRVAAEFGVATVWSWGWGTFNVAGADPDKQAAACVYLWTRDPSLCDGPAAAGSGFVDSLSEGQIDLPQGVQCALDKRAMRQPDLSRLAAVTHDRDVAYTILFDRLVESGLAKASPEAVRQAEQAIVDGAFNGSRPAFNAALARGGANIYVARSAIADELLRVQIEASIAVGAPSAGAIQAFYATYSDTLIRPFRVKPAAPWLGNRTSGFALAVAAPAALFRLPSATASPFYTGLGSYTVTPTDGAVPLGALPLDRARPAIATALRVFAKKQAYEDAARKRAESALSRTICLRDDLPNPAVVSVPTYLPFLALSS